jgi:hypothetical protein
LENINGKILLPAEIGPILWEPPISPTIRLPFLKQLITEEKSPTIANKPVIPTSSLLPTKTLSRQVLLARVLFAKTPPRCLPPMELNLHLSGIPFPVVEAPFIQDQVLLLHCLHPTPLTTPIRKLPLVKVLQELQ